MIWSHELDTPIVIVGALSAVACALLGNFLVLRRLSMMGDAISHAVLPGLAAAFWMTNSREGAGMFVGAAVIGICTAVFTQWVSSYGRVEEGASMGVVFTSLFALGLILMVQTADQVDIDPQCVLYGDLVYAALDSTTMGGWVIPRTAISLSVVLAVNAAFVLLFYKELRITAFDPELATALGVHAGLMHYTTMTLVAVTAVASFEAVGSILVIAMLIVPGATAYLLTDRLAVMIGLSVCAALASALLGHFCAVNVPAWLGLGDTSTAGMMAVVAGLLFCTAFLFAPRHGLLSKWARQFRLAVQIAREDVLGLLFRLEERRQCAAAPAVVEMLGIARGYGGVLTRSAMFLLRQSGQLTQRNAVCALTALGRAEAIRLVRAHRLWESYLQKHLQLPVDHLHAPAEELEHITDQRLQERLEVEMQSPQHDPHGRTIPRKEEP